MYDFCRVLLPEAFFLYATNRVVAFTKFPGKMSGVQKYIAQFQKLCQPRTRVLVLVMILAAIAVVVFQSFSLNPGNGSIHLLPIFGSRTLPSFSPSVAENVVEVHLTSGSETPAFPSHEVENRDVSVSGERVKNHHEINGIDEESDDFDIDGDGEQDGELSIDLWNGMSLKKVKDPYGGYITIQKSAKEGKDSLVGMDGGPGRGFVSTPPKDGETNSSLEFGKVKLSYLVAHLQKLAATSHHIGQLTTTLFDQAPNILNTCFI